MVEDQFGDAIKILENDRSVPPQERTPEGEGYLLIRTMLPPLKIDFSGKKSPYVFYPPQETFRMKVKAGKTKEIGKKLLRNAMNVKSYLAFPFGSSISYALLVSSKPLYFIDSIIGDNSPYFLRNREFFDGIREPEAHEEDWKSKISAHYSLVKNIIDKVEPESTLNETLTLMGRSTIIGDPELAFIIQWHSLELLAKEYFKNRIDEYKTNKNTALNSYLDQLAWKMTHGERVGLTVSDEIYAMLISKNVPIERAEMEKFRSLRNESVHGTVKTDDFAERSQLYQKFYNISRRTTFETMKEAGIVIPYDVSWELNF
jgi:hypothetical protein